MTPDDRVNLWLVVIADKELVGEPDVGLAIIEGTQSDADSTRKQMEAVYRQVGRCRCVGRIRQIEAGKFYRSTALIRTT